MYLVKLVSFVHMLFHDLLVRWYFISPVTVMVEILGIKPRFQI